MAVIVLVGRVVPHAGEPARRPVVNDPTADEHDSVDDVLDRPELVRDVEDRDAEVRAQRLEQKRRATPARRHRHPSSARRARAASARRRAPWRSAHAAASRRRAFAAVRRPGLASPTVSIARATASRSARRSGPQMPVRSQPSRGDDLAHRHRGLAEQPRPLRQVADAAAVGALAGSLAEHAHGALARALEPEHEPQQRRLAAAVRPCDRDELPGATASETSSSTRTPAR